jgi:hypothetical protein
MAVISFIVAGMMVVNIRRRKKPAVVPVQYMVYSGPDGSQVTGSQLSGLR